MTNATRRLGIHGALTTAVACATFLTASASTARAQDVPEVQKTALDRQLDRVDIGVMGVGQFSTNSNGTNYLAQSLNTVPSNTVGALVTVRYVKSPLIGFEFNYGYARYTENFTLVNSAASPAGATDLTLPIQTNANEYTLGYVAHTRGLHYGLQPYASVGLGTIAFKPTNGGGQGFLEQARAAYYYSVGVETPLYHKYFGLRAAFRQSIYLNPDYETNYIRDLKRTINSEPGAGFFIRF